MSFNSIIGNEKAKQFLKSAIDENHILHSYLFSGISGIGKSIFAKEFAKKVLCLEKQDNEEKCESCVKWNSNNHPDFMLIEPEGNTIKIEQIRNMQEKVAEKPIISNKKVYIIVDSELMTKEAQNCLLKTLEEPPEYATIILTTSNEAKLLNTIKSRCIKVKFNKLSNEEINTYCSQSSEQKDINEFIPMSQGSIGKLKEIENNIEIYKKINDILENIENKSLVDLLNESEVLYKEKENIYGILDYINIYIYNTKDIKKMKCIQYVEDTKKRLNSNSNYDMSIDYLLMRIYDEMHL